MPLPLYLAMTAVEIIHNPLPDHLAYMACHFSSYGSGLCDLPERLPKGSMLILNDRTPVWNHDPQLVAVQLNDVVEELQCGAVLLDLQRPDNSRSFAISEKIVQTLSCPVGVTEYYADNLSCPVFLSPPQPNQRLQAQIAKWTGREIWLEAALETRRVTLSSDGSIAENIPYAVPEEPCHQDDRLCCSYHIDVTQEQVVFTISRTPKDLEKLAEQAQNLGVTRIIGLYQQLGMKHKNPAD